MSYKNLNTYSQKLSERMRKHPDVYLSVDYFTFLAYLCFLILVKCDLCNTCIRDLAYCGDNLRQYFVLCFHSWTPKKACVFNPLLHGGELSQIAAGKGGNRGCSLREVKEKGG